MNEKKANEQEKKAIMKQKKTKMATSRELTRQPQLEEQNCVYVCMYIS